MSGSNPMKSLDSQHARQLGEWVVKQAQQMSGSSTTGSTSGGASGGTATASNPQAYEKIGKQIYEEVNSFNQSGDFPNISTGGSSL